MFFLGLAIGILATCCGSALVVWQLIRRAPVIDYNAEDTATTDEWEHAKGIPLYAITGDVNDAGERQRVEDLLDRLPDGSITIRGTFDDGTDLPHRTIP